MDTTNIEKAEAAIRNLAPHADAVWLRAAATLAALDWQDHAEFCRENDETPTTIEQWAVDYADRLFEIPSEIAPE